MGLFPPSGPGGIRTPGLFSAIEARSQLRYRPLFKAQEFYSKEIGMSSLNGPSLTLKITSYFVRFVFLCGILKHILFRRAKVRLGPILLQKDIL
jgi:hypothetical protein